MLEVKGRLSLDGRAWDNTIRGAEKGAGRLAGFLSNTIAPRIAAAFAVTAVISFTRHMADMAGQIKDSADRVGISTDAMQQWGHAAKRSGSDIGAVTTGFEKFVDAIQKIKSGEAGSDKLAESLGRFGISLEDIKNKNPEELFKKLGVSLEGLTVNGQVTADMLDIFGKSGGKLIPVLKSLREESGKLKGSFNFMTEEEINNLDSIGDDIDDLYKSAKLLAVRVPSGIKNLVDGTAGGMAASMVMTSTDPTKSDYTVQIEQLATISAMEKDLAERKRLKTEKELADIEKKKAAEAEAAKAAEASLKRKDALNEETAKVEEKMRWDGLTKEQQLNELIENRKKLLYQVDFNKKNNLDDTEFGAQIRNNLAETDSRIQGLRGANTAVKETVGNIGSSSGVSVGNFLGTTGASMLNAISKQQLDKLTSIDKTLQSMRGMGGGSGIGSLSSNVQI